MSDKRTPILGIVYNRLRYVNENARLPEYLRQEMREALHDLARLAHVCTCGAMPGVKHAIQCALSRPLLSGNSDNISFEELERIKTQAKQ